MGQTTKPTKSRGRAPKIPRGYVEEIKRAFFSGELTSAAALAEWLAQKGYSYSKDGIYKLVRSIENTDGVTLIPRHGKRGRPDLLSNEQRKAIWDALQEDPKLDLLGHIATEYHIEYSPVGIYMLRRRLTDEFGSKETETAQ